MTQYKILLFALMLSFVACDTVVDVDIPDEPPRLVANAFLMADSAVVLELTQSQSILSNAPLQPVSGATAILLENDREVATLEELNSGNYCADFTPKVGNQYTLRISKGGYESVEATTSVRPAVVIQALEVDTVVSFYDGYDNNSDSIFTQRDVRINEARLTFSDPAGERNYYEVTVYRYQTYWEEVLNDQGEYVESKPMRTLAPLYLRSDDSALTGAGDDFVEGDGGEAYGQVLSFSDDFFNSKTYTFRFIPEYYVDYYSQESSQDYKIYVTLRSIDEGRYRYLRSVDLQYENDGNPFAEPVQVYSNVANGFGIVSGSSASQVTVDLR